MKPMVLKQPTECCKSPTLVWIVEKGYYCCPCGKFKARDNGQPFTRHFNPFNRNLRSKVKDPGR